MQVVLSEPFETLWAGKDPFACAEALEGEVYREMPGRRTLRTHVNGADYFVKIHRGIGWGEIIKNWLTFKAPVLGAGQEWAAIQRLTEVGVPTMKSVAFAERGSNPAQQHSFIITEALEPTISLEDYTAKWREQPPKPALKWALIEEVAKMTGTMHRAGVNHRDCYLCHFLLHTDEPIEPETLLISLIDLHRAQIRPQVPLRWRNKDLAGLYFSAAHIGLTQRDLLRFLRHYFAQPLRDVLREEGATLRQLQRMEQQLEARQERHGGAL